MSVINVMQEVQIFSSLISKTPARNSANKISQLCCIRKAASLHFVVQQRLNETHFLARRNTLTQNVYLKDKISLNRLFGFLIVDVIRLKCFKKMLFSRASIQLSFAIKTIKELSRLK
jgi:hypothetical protein